MPRLAQSDQRVDFSTSISSRIETPVVPPFYAHVVVEKTVPRRNPWGVCVNGPLHVGTSFVVLYIFNV